METIGVYGFIRHTIICSGILIHIWFHTFHTLQFVELAKKTCAKLVQIARVSTSLHSPIIFWIIPWKFAQRMQIQYYRQFLKCFNFDWRISCHVFFVFVFLYEFVYKPLFVFSAFALIILLPSRFHHCFLNTNKTSNFGL